MKKTFFLMIVAIVVLSTLTASAQMIKRQDAIWARTTTSTITLDGKLTEAAWATAESLTIQYGQTSGMPGGGWFPENGKNTPPADPTNATVKFLVKGDSLYIGLVCRDKSIGAGLFNQFDGVLMNLRYKQATGFQGTPTRDYNTAAAFEIFYGWVSEGWADTNAVLPGAKPAFLGWAGNEQYKPRTDSLKAVWNAFTTVQGTQNNDAGAVDTSWTTEFKFNLKPWGYSVSQPAGDIVMWSLSIYDADYRWPVDTSVTSKTSGNRVWLQCPWGNASVFNHLRIFARPDVGTTGAVPAIGPDVTVPNGNALPNIAFDGKLTDNAWRFASSLKIKYGDAATRNAYANTAPYRSGQFQPDVNGGKAVVTDPNTATVKYFFKADTLFLGFDVLDKVVQSVEGNFDRWDGFRVTINERDTLNGDNVLRARRLSFIVSPTGKAILEDDFVKDSLRAAVVLSLKGGTTIDTLGASADSGYTAEMKIVLTKFGYPTGRGDGVVFLGIAHFDGDSFTPASGSYGTRTWFMRENDNNDGAAWVYLDPSLVLGVESNGTGTPSEFALLGNYPNPFNPSTTIRFQMAQTSNVTLEVYDVLGRQTASQELGVREAGMHSVPFNAAKLASGTYYYRLKVATTGATLVGKMLLLK